MGTIDYEFVTLNRGNIYVFTFSGHLGDECGLGHSHDDQSGQKELHFHVSAMG